MHFVSPAAADTSYSEGSGSGLEVARPRRRAKLADMRDRLRSGGFSSGVPGVGGESLLSALPELEDASLPEFAGTAAAAVELSLPGAAVSGAAFVDSGAESAGAEPAGAASEATGVSESAAASLGESPSTAATSPSPGLLLDDLADALREVDFRGRRVRGRLFGAGRASASSS